MKYVLGTTRRSSGVTVLAVIVVITNARLVLVPYTNFSTGYLKQQLEF
jgi:hypothetical protein